jgi:hypothetical protein
MGLQIRCYVEGRQEFIDLYPDERIEIEISFAEIQDIAKKNSAYTKEFKVPGSKNNNYIFNYFYDINQVFTNWNPKKKFEADLIYDGYEIYNGYVRLNSVTINKREKVYSITFYSAVGDLSANIGDKALCNVDTTSLNHNFYQLGSAVFYDPSLSNRNALNFSTPPPYNPVLEGDVHYILGQRGYDYTGSTFADIRDIDTSQTPVLDFSGVTGFFDFSGTPVVPTYLIPSIRTNKLYELIVNQAGYTLESEFFESSYFDRYYIPLSFNSDQPYMAQAEDYVYEWVNNSGYTTELSYDVNGTIYNLLEARQITKENMGFNPVTYSEYSASTPQLSAYTDYIFALPYTNNLPLTYTMSITVVYTGSTYCSNPPSCGDFIGDMTLWRYTNGNSTQIFANAIAAVPFFASDAGPLATNTYYYTGSTTPVGERDGTSLYFMTYNYYPFFASGYAISGATFEVLDTPKVLPKTIKLYKEMSCDQKQIDFIQNINRTFNLVVVEHPIKPKTLIVEPMINYIGKGRLLDWTSKVDYDSSQNIYPTTNIINGSLFLANKQDKDYINTQYNTKTNQIFGQKFVDLGIDYKNNNINLVQTLGQNTDYYLNASGSTNLALSCYFITKENNKNGISNFEYRPFRSLPRQVFLSVPVNSGNTKQFFFYRYALSTVGGLDKVTTIQNVNRFTTYPFGISGFSHYTIYDAENRFTDDELIFPEAETMYDRYYRDYVEDLISDENKVYQCRMYLTPWEVSNLYFNESILIKNAKFRINKISGLSLLEPGMCNVELVKLTRDYTPTPVLFYDLISCSDPCDVIHTHTDLVYPIWAYEGLFVQVGYFIVISPTLRVYSEKRMKVVKTDYNANYNYETVFISPYSQYVTYTGCSDASKVDTLYVYNNFTGSTYTGDCVSMTVTNTGVTSQTFSFKYCDGTNGSWTLDPSSAITLCGLYSSFDTTGFSYCLSSFSACTSWTPLPTPTPTVTPGLSPSPTLTPTKTPGLSPSPTETPSPTPSVSNCRINTVLNITDTGYIKYQLCSGSIQYVFVPTLGSYTITDCIVQGTVTPGFPLADVANFTITSTGTPC